MHHPHGSSISDGISIEEFMLPDELYLSDVNVLGAGDYFASGFINSMINGSDIKTSVINAHRTTTNLLKDNLI